MREDRLGELFERDLELIDLPAASSWIPSREARERRWSAWLAVPLAAGAIAVGVLVAVGLQMLRGDLPPAAPPTPSAVISPSIPPAVTPTPSGTRSGPRPVVEGVEAHPLREMSGQWALLLRRATPLDPARPTDGGARDAIEAVRLSDGLAQTVVTFTSGIGQRGGQHNLLREQLSPNGHELVLSVVLGAPGRPRDTLVVVHLPTGSVRQLTTDSVYEDQQPAWSPAGDEIAFVRKTSVTAGSFGEHDAGIWVVPASGGTPRRVLAPPASPWQTSLISWTGDGSGLHFVHAYEGSPSYVLELTTGRVNPVGQGSTGRGDGDWRQGSLAYVGAHIEGPFAGERRIVVAEALGADARVLARAAHALNSFFLRARWRPGGDEFLYVSSTGIATGGAITEEVVVSGVASPSPRMVLRETQAVQAEWSPDGARIVYYAGRGAAGALRTIRPDGTDDRVIQTLGGGARVMFLDLAVVGY